MKKLLSSIIVFTCLMSVGCQTSKTTLQTLSDSDITVIKEATEMYRDAEFANDWSTVTQLYTQNAIRMIPSCPTIRGRDAILEEFQARPYRITEYDQRVEEIEGYGDLAVVRGIFSWTIDRNGEFLSGTGKYIAIYRKQEDGSWLISHDIFNQD
jgi:ketosteroid isomerase-like protein